MKRHCIESIAYSRDIYSITCAFQFCFGVEIMNTTPRKILLCFETLDIQNMWMVTLWANFETQNCCTSNLIEYSKFLCGPLL